MLDDLLQQARRLGASDLHVAVGYAPMVRIDGNLEALLDDCDKRYHTACTDYLVAEAMLRYNYQVDARRMQSFLEQTVNRERLRQLAKQGEIDFAMNDGAQGRCRVNVYKANANYAMSIRLIKQKIPTCEELGLPQVIQNFVKAKHGLFLVTGPTGSGKSTTLAALIQKLNQERSLHVITLEEPIEYTYPLGQSIISQREIGQDTASFATGLKSALREDPDVILVGELRDAEALKVALQAAETGHLVLSTLHTRDAVMTINRILDMLPEQREQVRAQLADCLLGIVSQELYPRKDRSGRVAALEILINNKAVSNLIREGRTHQIFSYIQTCGKMGMQTMATSVAELTKQKII